MKKLVQSILLKGIASPYVKEFYSICIKMSMAYLNLTKYKQFSKTLQIKMGITLKDLARDCIDDLFETKEGSFIHINNYFFKVTGDDLEKIHEDEIKAHLAILVKSKTIQQLSELREAFGEIYFKIKKAVSIYLSRNKSIYKQIYFDGSSYIYACNPQDLNFDLIQISSEFLLQELYEMIFQKYQIPEIIRAIFRIINEQGKYCKAIKYDTLLKILKEFYISRMNDHQLENVEYY